MSATDDIRAISDLIDGSYPVDLDREAMLWRRCAKIGEEHGEVIEALLGMLGENPRKGYTHTRGDLVMELLDVALAALAAVCHVQPGIDPIQAVSNHAATRLVRVRDAITQVGGAR